jgi:hypothetical protein
MMPTKLGRSARFILRLAAAAALCSTVVVQAFVPVLVVHRAPYHLAHQQRNRVLSSQMKYWSPPDNSDEWYSPPPVVPKKAAAADARRPPADQSALQTDITTAAELHDFLHNSDDQRLTIVKFYASWYV